MKMTKRIISVGLAAMMFIACLAFLAGCSCSEKQKFLETPKDNILYEYDEVRELNGYSRVPYMLGTAKQDIKSDYEYRNGSAENHYESYRSKENKDVMYLLSTKEYHYNEKSDTLYVTGFRVNAEDKELKKAADGSTYYEYTTSRNVLGIKIGDKIDAAEKVLKKYGYEKLYNETWEGGLPKTLEYTFKKGIVVVTLGVESGVNDVTQIYVWIPYFTEDIDAFNAECHLPADLGFSYSVYANSSFEYDKKTPIERAYKTADGCYAILRGFPDYVDPGMTAFVSFTSSSYDVLGIKTGTSVNDAAAKLTGAGWTETNDVYTSLLTNREGDVRFFTKGVVVIGLVSAPGSDTVTTIEVSLAESTNISGIDTEF